MKNHSFGKTWEGGRKEGIVQDEASSFSATSQLSVSFHTNVFDKFYFAVCQHKPSIWLSQGLENENFLAPQFFFFIAVHFTLYKGLGGFCQQIPFQDIVG